MSTSHPMTPVRRHTLFTTMLMIMLAMGSIACIFGNRDDTEDECNTDTYEATCNSDGTVTYCDPGFCGFGPCSPDELVTSECLECMVMDGGEDMPDSFMCQQPVDQGTSEDMSSDMSGGEDQGNAGRRSGT